jgi:hypothetical protein
MKHLLKKGELEKNSNYSQSIGWKLMGIPSNPNEHLILLLDKLYSTYGEEVVNQQIKVEGLSIFLQKILIGNMSSSVLLKQLINRYGFEEVEYDLNWLKELELKEDSNYGI